MPVDVVSSTKIAKDAMIVSEAPKEHVAVASDHVNVSHASKLHECRWGHKRARRSSHSDDMPDGELPRCAAPPPRIATCKVNLRRQQVGLVQPSQWTAHLRLVATMLQI